MSWLWAIWLFPLNIIGRWATTDTLGTFDGVPVRVLPKHPAGSFSMAFGDIIGIHPDHMERVAPDTGDTIIFAVSARLLAHERRHCWDQSVWGGAIFLITYAFHFVVLAFTPGTGAYLNGMEAYRGVFWEWVARVDAEEADGKVFFTVKRETWGTKS